VSDPRAISYEDAISITPSDSATFAKPYAGFICGGAGNVQITTMRNRVAVIPCNAGVVYTFPFLKLWNTNTTASGIVAVSAQPYMGPN
jgi:hypothetical protein